MAASIEKDESGDRTDENLRAERERSDEELEARSTALAEDSDEVIVRARERARAVLELARGREDAQLLATGATAQTRASVQQERRIADSTLAAERDTADAKLSDERERRRAAAVQLLAYERVATDRTLAEERHLADRGMGAREDLLAVVAHDLRNMVSTVMLNASALLLVPELSMVAKPAAQIQRAGAQMSQLLEDLLDFSSFEAGNLSLHVDDVDLVRVVSDAVSLHEELARDHRLTLTMRADVPSVTVRADARRLTRLLMNLIVNACKFTPPEGRVEVSVVVGGDECEIAVADTGVGIPADRLASIFERFQQLDQRPQRSSGVGLGLYIARLIADAHGGRIWAESAPAAGATFRVRLPRHVGVA